MFVTVLFTIPKIQKQPKCPSMDIWMCLYIHECIYTHTYTYNRILFSHKKGRNFATCSNADGLGGHYAI